MIKTIIFDWSGVISDELDADVATVKELFEARGFPQMTKEKFLEFYELPWENFYKKQGLPVDLDKEYEDWAMVFPKHFSKLKIFPEAKQVLEQLKAKGKKILILSAHHQDLLRKEIAQFGLEGIFDAIESSNRDKRAKINKLLQENNVDAEEAVFVGDTSHDIETAKHAGITSIGIPSGFEPKEKLVEKKPDFLIEKISELPELIERIEKNQSNVQSDFPQIAKITNVVEETPSIKTFYLDLQMEAKPGQFVMAWLPSIDEKPFTLTAIGKEIAITVQAKGKFTQHLHELKVGNTIGIRGPYGNGFNTQGIKSACIVAGGCGAAPVFLLAQELQMKKTRLAIILGAKTGSECLFKSALEKTTRDFHITTDDGSLGEKGFTTQKLEELLKKEKFDCVFACGPEIMLVKVFELCERFGQECQLNLERYCKCSMGICGQCVIDEFRVCKDGPVFSSGQLRKMPSFGKTAILKSGKKVSLKDYADWKQG